LPERLAECRSAGRPARSKVAARSARHLIVEVAWVPACRFAGGKERPKEWRTVGRAGGANDVVDAGWIDRRKARREVGRMDSTEDRLPERAEGCAGRTKVAAAGVQAAEGALEGSGARVVAGAFDGRWDRKKVADEESAVQ
jgi:hypothetical protein